MGKDSAITWTDHTFNPWWGCSKAPGDPQCINCFAERWAKRCGYRWGLDAERRLFGEKHWRDPVLWNKQAESAGIRQKVFAGSMCDVFERTKWQTSELDVARAKLWSLIEECSNLDWLLLTKRPQNVADMVPEAWMKGGWPRNAWMGISAGTQPILDERGRRLMQIPAPIQFVSIEPMLGKLEVRNGRANRWSFPTRCDSHGRGCEYTDPGDAYVPFDWVIVGGESGPNARPFYVPYARWIKHQVEEAGRALFIKQMGACPVVSSREAAAAFQDVGAKLRLPGPAVIGLPSSTATIGLALGHQAGADPSQWPEDLRVQQFPSLASKGGEREKGERRG